MSQDIKRQNRNLAISSIGLFLSMILLSAASVPLYNLFCKATGFAGTPQRGTKYSSTKGTRQIYVRFDANTDKKLPWNFVAKNDVVKVTTGENTLIFYEAKNISKQDVIGTAVYNVTPMKAGKYFIKVHCFCFEEQMLKAGESMVMPVSFFIDPDFDKDPYMNDVETITLSYSFYKVRDV